MNNLIKVANIENTIYRVDWDLGRACNYNCSYCTSHTVGLSPVNKSIEQYINGINFIHKIYGYPNNYYVYLLGGEPLLYTNILKVIEKLFNTNFNITTNLSVSNNYILKKIIILKNNLVISASYHAEYANPIEWVEKVKLLQRFGIYTKIKVMMHPKNDLWNKCLQVLKEFPTSYSVLRNAENIYSKDQMSYLENLPKNLEKVSIRYTYEDNTFKDYSIQEIRINKLNNFKGMYCDLGLNGLVIQENGDIYLSNCNQLYKKLCIGNVFIEDIHIPKNPIICPFSCCWCNADLKHTKSN